MKKMTISLAVVFALICASTGLQAQKALTGTEYFSGFWIVSVEMAPEYSFMASFYTNEEKKFVGSVSGSDGSFQMLDNVKVEGNLLTASISNPEMGTINIRIEKKDGENAVGDIMDGSSAITCKRYVPEKN
mgnify:CR=1 FL=1|jgi:hypothetical protein